MPDDVNGARAGFYQGGQTVANFGRTKANGSGRERGYFGHRDLEPFRAEFALQSFAHSVEVLQLAQLAKAEKAWDEQHLMRAHGILWKLLLEEPRLQSRRVRRAKSRRALPGVATASLACRMLPMTTCQFLGPTSGHRDACRHENATPEASVPHLGWLL